MISLLQAKTRWRQKTGNEELIENLSHSLGLTPFVTALLVHRGLQTETAITNFLYTEKQDFHDPFLLQDMKKVTDRIYRAIKEKEHVLIFGDYDADGVSSTTVLYEALQELGAQVEFYIPNRFTEGYGPNEGAFRWAKEAGFSLIITVDTGISAVKEANLAKELGIDLIITDHHEPPPHLPDAYAIIHPKLDDYPFKELAGVGVAFKVAHALLGRVPEHLLEIAVIGTIADLVPLHGENRLLAKRGIEKLRQTKRPGLLALLQLANSNPKEANEETIGFTIGPRINAVGRLEDAAPAVHLLLTKDMEEAKALAEEIDVLNKHRQEIVKQIAQEAIQEVEELYPPEQNKVLVIAREGWNAGVVGIVASKLVERFYRPTIILSIDRDKGIAKGSARSIEGFDLFANLSDCRDILPHFGGHPMAAGMTLQLEDVDELRVRLNKLADIQLMPEDLLPVTAIDVTCQPRDITLSSIAEMSMLAPFGVGNPKPRLLIEDASLESIRQIGADGSHLKLTMRDEEVKLDGVGFGFGQAAEEISPISKVSIVGEASINEWNNVRKPQIMIADIAVTDWQLFDWRSMRNVEKHIAMLPKNKVKIVYFRPETLEKFSVDEYRDYLIPAAKASSHMEGNYVILLDMPPTTEHLRQMFINAFPARIYAVFYQEMQHTFSTIPTREHFKWYYSFLRQQAPFSIVKHGAQLCAHKGWSKDTVNFMTMVFFELEFVKIKDGVIFIAHQTQKRDLTESATYREKVNQLQLEKELVYSTYQQLKMWFQHMKDGSAHEEALR